MSLTPEDVAYVREALELSQRQFAAAMGVSALSIARWETEQAPKGLPAHVLGALHRVVLETEAKEDDLYEMAILRGLVMMGIGPLFLHLLRQRLGFKAR